MMLGFQWVNSDPPPHLETGVITWGLSLTRKSGPDNGPWSFPVLATLCYIFKKTTDSSVPGLLPSTDIHEQVD